GATLGQLGESPAAIRLVRAGMTECALGASALGGGLPVSVDQRVAGGIAVGYPRASLLADPAGGAPRAGGLSPRAVAADRERGGVEVPEARAVHELVTALGDLGYPNVGQ